VLLLFALAVIPLMFVLYEMGYFTLQPKEGFKISKLVLYDRDGQVIDTVKLPLKPLSAYFRLPELSDKAIYRVDIYASWTMYVEDTTSAEPPPPMDMTFELWGVSPWQPATKKKIGGGVYINVTWEYAGTKRGVDIFPDWVNTAKDRKIGSLTADQARDTWGLSDSGIGSFDLQVRRLLTASYVPEGEDDRFFGTGIVMRVEDEPVPTLSIADFSISTYGDNAPLV